MQITAKDAASIFQKMQLQFFSHLKVEVLANVQVKSLEILLVAFGRAQMMMMSELVYLGIVQKVTQNSCQIFLQTMKM